MSETQQVILTLGSIIGVMSLVIGAMGLAMRGMSKDNRDGNRLTMQNAEKFANLLTKMDANADDHQRQRDQWAKEGRELKDAVGDLTDKVDDLEKGREADQARIAQLEREAASLRASLAEKDKLIQQLETDMKLLKAQNAELLKEQGRYQADRVQWAKREAEFEAQQKAWADERQRLLDERATLMERLATLECTIEDMKRHGTGPLPPLEDVMAASVQGAIEPTEESPKEAEEPTDGTVH